MSRIPSLPIPPTIVSLAEIFTSGTLVAATGSVQSGFLDVRNFNMLRISRTATAGAYALEIDWSRDGVNVDLTQAVALNNNSGIEVLVFLPFVRIRVRNTDALAAFTAHRTNVFGR